MSHDEGDRLIHRHLEGMLAPEETAALEARLKSDPAFRRRLAEMAFDRAQMKEVLSAGAAESATLTPAAAPRIPRRALLPMAAAAIILASVGIAVVLGPLRGAAVAPSVAPAAPPRDSTGFAGGMTGKVVSRGGEAVISLRVTAVSGHPAGHPLVGRVVYVAGGVTRVGEGFFSHAEFLRRLERDQEVTLDVQHSKDDVFVTRDLTPEQLEWARNREDGRKRPADGREDPVRRGDRPKKNPGREEDRDRPREE